MTKIWVEFLADHKHGKKGEKTEIEEAVGKALITAEVAKACEKPEEPSPEALALTETIKTLIKTETDAIRADLKNETKNFSSTITKSFGALHHATAKDAALEARFGFETEAAFFKAVYKSSPSRDGSIPSGCDERLIKAATGLNTNVGQDGGFLVPAETAANILETAWATSNLAGRTDRMTFGGGSLTVKALDESNRGTGNRRGGVRGYWLSEADQFTASKPKFREILLKPHKLGVFYYATEEQQSDTGFNYNLPAKLAQYAGEEIGWMIDEAILAGDGVGKPLGVVNAPCTVEIAKESGQTAATINYVNLRKMFLRMLPPSINKAVWYINNDIWGQLLDLKWPDASGTMPVFINGAQYPNVSGAPYGTLFGRPIEVTEHNETLGTVGDIVFADLSQYILATKGGINSAMSIHLRFDYEETCWRFSFRVDGQPWMNKVITPAKGTATTLSPFITLATRA